MKIKKSFKNVWIIIVAWNSPVLSKFSSNNTEVNPLGAPLSVVQLSICTSIFPTGSLISAAIITKLPDIFGRKKTLIYIATVGLTSLVVLSFVNNFWLYCIIFLISTISISAGIIVVPTYVSEISEIQNRGSLGTVVAISKTLGQLYTFLLAPVTNFSTFCLCCGAPLLLHILMSFFTQESPVFLYIKGDTERAKISLKKLRRNRMPIELEEEMKEKEKMLQTKLTVSPYRVLFQSPAGKKAFLLALMIRSTPVLSGVYIILSFLSKLLNEAGTNLIFIAYGNILAWNSPVLTTFSSNNTEVNPLGTPLTVVQLSICTSIYPIGSLISAPIITKLPDIFGRKRILIYLATIGLTSFVVLSFIKSFWLYCITFLILTITISAGTIVVPTYVSEISEIQNRGFLGTAVAISKTVGQLYTFLLAPVTNFRTFCLCCAAPLLLHILISFFTQESPVFLFIKGDPARANISLKKLRRNKIPIELEEEMKEKQNMLQTKHTMSSYKNLFQSSAGRKAFFLSLMIRDTSSLSGIYIIVSFLRPHSGACVILERILEKKFLYFPCRHHVYELVLQKACQTCLSATSGSNVSTFERFRQTWKNIDQSNHITGLDNEIIRDKVMDKRDAVFPFISE
ncbi:unnamed protein product [Psylliodes chrysocephalus]|uniref:Major facilitator superfamily (MFS) profile domain-containing protein n=1 Tax=Psylliodes chrysocephalus TaxID=3402493 RepID=A0A9P0CK58_9CUCU|nr:unnamed protein product [Psylliodes chrysocephala]